MENQQSEPKTFWSTLPGIITGLAGVVTAITGLIIALSQMGVFHKEAKEERTEIKVPTQSSRSNETQNTISSIEDKPISPATSSFEAKFSITSIKINPELK